MDSWIPIEVHHGRESMAVVAQLPGVRIGDLRIELTRDLLTIDAHTPLGERQCTLALAAPVDARRATMHFRDGILRMHLPTLPT
jgi:HSP20 family molecular chaperone IbpA